MGTQHWTEGAKCFNRITGELEAVMARKGYTSVTQFVNKLKPHVKVRGRRRRLQNSASRRNGTFDPSRILRPSLHWGYELCTGVKHRWGCDSSGR